MAQKNQGQKALEDVTIEVRRLFHALSAEADQLHENLGVTASERGVLESLEPGEPLTVPSIARSKGVSRQHIQTIMNGLLGGGLVRPVDNPAHQRSPLFELTEAGESAFVLVRVAEAKWLRDVAWNLRAEDLLATAKVLRAVRSEVEVGD